MAVLSDPDRATVTKTCSDDFSDRRDESNVTKAELRAVVDAIDTWVNDNAAAVNQAIPQPQRANLTDSQKARIFQFVLERRYIVDA